MSKQKDETVTTNLRMPKHLHHKLGILASADDRSLNSYILKLLIDHVTNVEETILDVYDVEGFSAAYEIIFGEDHSPYYFHKEIKIDLERAADVFLNDITRGKQRGGTRIKLIPTEQGKKLEDEIIKSRNSSNNANSNNESSDN